ncbi:MAG: mechanosensitive ion channel domain-containing protein [Pseudolabrys sp.]
MDSLRAALTKVKDLLDWLPDPLVAVMILGIAVLVALALHRWARKLARRALAGRYPYLYSTFNQTSGLSRLALLILAMIVAIPVAPLKPEFAEMLARLMAVAVIGLIGWGAIIASHIAASLYLRRFSLDSDDNLLARKHNTQVQVLSRTLDVVLVLLTLGAALMTFPAVRQYGLSLFASAGIAGIIAGLAARPVLSNLMAGVQLAMTQPIRLYDGVTVENEYGTVEEITSTYVVVKLWDLRRLIVPLTYFIEKPFQNWTRDTSALIGNVMLYVDYAAPVDVIRAKFSEILKQSDKWDGRIAALQVTDFKEGTMELRCLMSARTASQTFDLRCVVRKADRIFAERTPGSAATLAPDQPQGSARGTEDAALAGEPLKRIRPA